MEENINYIYMYNKNTMFFIAFRFRRSNAMQSNINTQYLEIPLNDKIKTKTGYGRSHGCQIIKHFLFHFTLGIQC